MIDYRIYLVTDDPSRYSGDWLENVRAAVEGGVTCVQYRDTENAPRIQYERILRLRDALASFRTPLIVNNDAELAKAVKAEGIHVGQGDLQPTAVRAIVGPGCEIGRSITCLKDVERDFPSEARDIDCIGIGPVFDARKTKVDAAEAMGPEGLRRIVTSLTREECLVPVDGAAGRPMPRVAIGGITFQNAETVLSAGATGLAVVSAFSKAEDPYEVARRFTMLFDNRGL